MIPYVTLHVLLRHFNGGDFATDFTAMSSSCKPWKKPQPSNTHTFLMEKFLWVGVMFLTFLCSMHAQAVIWVAEVPFSQPSGVRNNSGCMCKGKKVHWVHFFSFWAASRIMNYIDRASHGTHNFGVPTCQRLICLLSATAKNTNCFAPFSLSGLIWHYAHCPANSTQSLGKFKLHFRSFGRNKQTVLGKMLGKRGLLSSR